MTNLSFTQNFTNHYPKLQTGKEEAKNLSEKSKIELMDLLYREERLCKNRKFLEKLPDKGAKILNFYEEVKAELERRNNQEKLCGELAKLTVDENRTALERLEWTGDYKTDSREPVVEDDSNLFRILATHSSTEVSRHKNFKCETQKDVQQLVDDDLPKVDAYAKELCNRFDANADKSTRKKFYTHKPLKKVSIKNGAKDEIKKNSSSVSNSNDLNPASEVKILSLQESINVQHQQFKTLKEIEYRSAIEKLRSKIEFKCRSPPFVYHDYREQSSGCSDDEVSNSFSQEDSEQEDE